MSQKTAWLFTIIIVSSFMISVFLTYKWTHEKNNSYIFGEEKSSNISIMIFDDKVNDYVFSNEVPKGMYVLNKEKTKCAGSGRISLYDSLAGNIKYEFESADECYIYFDTTKNAVESIMRLYLGQETASGNGKLYLHDSSLENGANDNSLRYAGPNPDNYVCFYGEDCNAEDNLYRIIGVFNNRVKLIKYKSIGNMKWNESGTNIWNGSSIEKYINEIWLTEKDIKYNLIETYVWSVDGCDRYSTPKITYDIEMNKKVTISRKVGLLYIQEYGYAASSNAWSADFLHYNSYINDNWLYTNEALWLISRHNQWSNAAFNVEKAGSTNGYGVNVYNYAIHPTFYLKENIKIKGGLGTVSNPYVLVE